MVGRWLKGYDLAYESATMERTCACSNSKHSCRGSEHPRELVPIKDFMKREGDYDDLFSTCEPCRVYTRNRLSKERARRNMIAQTSKTLPNPEFLYCPGRSHDV